MFQPRWSILFLLIPVLCSGRETVVEFNTKAVPPNIDVLWQVSVNGDFVDMTSKDGGLVLTADSGNFSVQKVMLNPIGGSDRPSITVGAAPPYWTTRFNPFGVVYELTVHQAITQGGQAKTVQIPIAVHLLEERVEEKPIVAEFRNLRVQGTQDSQNLDYTFDVALVGTYCPNDATFFVQSESHRSLSGATDVSGDFKPVHIGLQAGTTVLIKDLRVSLFGPKPEDRRGVFRLALVGRDSKGNLLSTQCEVPLNPPWANGATRPAPVPPSGGQ